MTNAYDDYLNPVLEKATDEELAPIVECLLTKFSNKIRSNDAYKNNPDKPSSFVALIANEIRAMGGNSFNNLFRHGGIPYSDLIRNVAHTLGIKYSPNSSVENIEKQILNKIFCEYVKQLSQVEVISMWDHLELESYRDSDTIPKIEDLFKIANSVQDEISDRIVRYVNENKIKMRFKHFCSIPCLKSLNITIGNVGVEAVTTAFSFTASPSAIVIPCVIHVALLRLKQDCVSA